MIILLHSSKTMRQPTEVINKLQQPLLIDKAVELQTYLRSLSVAELGRVMHISEKVALKTKAVLDNWNPASDLQLPAIDSFIGDIYSGLRVHELSEADRKYANKTLLILSGLYGVLKPLDTIQPYRLEMGYRLPNESYRNLYNFWGDDIARTIPDNEVIINTSAEEYTKAVLPHMPNAVIITPRFLTVSPKTGEPTFVVVHAKIARGAFAHWIIKNRVEDVSELSKFADLDYDYNKELSTPSEPVYVCKSFGGLGLSVRLR